jgi:hypothetical protein
MARSADSSCATSKPSIERLSCGQGSLSDGRSNGPFL